ncbi:Hypothetical protein NTJ_00423 [Nesidiocoris tenuis]|uniref:Uncharacterized protein n=1 Tax=Nesidiocoris tenuis TaxID=355587 RepID=A0ABN7A8Q6_9HEMI|nr:Hypothetical protein NTJ_00423 [Nesidiocoris tenuis]
MRRTTNTLLLSSLYSIVSFSSRNEQARKVGSLNRRKVNQVKPSVGLDVRNGGEEDLNERMFVQWRLEGRRCLAGCYVAGVIIVFYAPGLVHAVLAAPPFCASIGGPR